MANSDYTVRTGSNGFCPVGYLTADIGPLDSEVTMSGYTSPIADGIRIGMAAMITSVIPADPHADSVVLLVQGGVDGSGVINDLSSYGDSVTIASGAAFDDAQQVLGSNMIHVTPYNLADIPAFTGNAARFGRAAGESLTIECWVRWPASGLGNFTISAALWALIGPGSVTPIVRSTLYTHLGNLQLTLGIAGDAQYAALSPDTPHFIQFTVIGDTYYYDLDGVEQATGALSAYDTPGTYEFQVASLAAPNSQASEYFATPLRVTKGVARPRGSVPAVPFQFTSTEFNQEIVVVTARDGNDLTLGRGCCDTVPAPHSAGDAIWFFDESIGTDRLEYAGTATIGVKPLPRVTTGTLPIEHSPPAELTFNLRFARPYPPGLVTVNGDPWFTTPLALTLTAPTLELAWAHRDRITQQDQLIDHLETDIGPEAGTTYEIRVYREDGTLLRTVVGITDTTWTYELADAIVDFSAAGDEYPGYLTLCSMRDGLASFQQYRIDFTLASSTEPVIDDPYWENVKLLIQGGADGTLVVNDRSVYASSVTIGANASWSDDHQVFGDNAIQMRLYNPDIPEFTGDETRFGRSSGEDMTVEMYFRFSVLDTYGHCILYWIHNGDSDRLIHLVVNPNGSFEMRQGGTTTSFGIVFSADTTYFIQLTVIGNTYYLDIGAVGGDGTTTQIGTGSFIVAASLGTYSVCVGSYITYVADPDSSTMAWVSPLRWTKGVARSRGFIPTEPFIGALPDVPDTTDVTLTLTASIPEQPAGASIAMNLTQLAAPISTGSAYVAIFYIPLSLLPDPAPAGRTIYASFGLGLSQSIAVETVLSYTTTASTAHADIMDALIAQANAAAPLSSRGLVAGSNSYTGRPGMQISGPVGLQLHSTYDLMTPGLLAPIFSPVNNMLVVEFALGSPVVAVALNQFVTATISGTPAAGDRFTVTLNGVPFGYTAESGDSLSDVATALAAVIDADSSYAAAAVGAVITIDGVTSTNVFSYAAASVSLFAY